MKHTLWYKAILLGAVVLAVLLVGLVPRATPAAAAGSISLRNATVPQGATVSVSGSSFTSNDTVALYVDTTVNGRGQRIQTAVTADGNGSFSTHLALPRNVDPGSYTVNARDTHGVSASAHLAVLPLIVLRVNSGAPTISVTDRQGFFVDAFGFSPNESVKIAASFPQYDGNTTIQVRNSTADAHGNVYNVGMYAPPGTKAGSASLDASGQTSSRQAQGHVTVGYSPYIYLSHSTVTAGSAVTINGRGFVASATVRIQITIPGNGGATQTLTVNASADNNGNFARSLNVPGYTPSGTYTVTATDLTGGFKRYSKVTVTSRPAPRPTATPKPTATPRPTYHPALQILPNVTLPNQTVTVAGTGFTRNTGVNVSLTVDLQGGGNKTVNAGSTTDSNGGFATTLSIPANAAQGTYTVNVSAGGLQASGQLQVLPQKSHPKNLRFKYISLWYHAVRQGTWDYVAVQSTVHRQLGIWAHVIFPGGQHYDYYTVTDGNGYWATRFNVPARAVTRHSNTAYVTMQLWHGSRTTQSFLDFTVV